MFYPIYLLSNPITQIMDEEENPVVVVKETRWMCGGLAEYLRLLVKSQVQVGPLDRRNEEVSD